jgi:hypothetical protein
MEAVASRGEEFVDVKSDVEVVGYQGLDGGGDPVWPLPAARR